MSSGRAQLAFQHGHKDLLPAFLLSRDGLGRVEPLLQAQPRSRLLNAQHAPAIGEFQQKQFNAAFHARSVESETKFRQHLVEPGWGRDALLGVGRLCSALEGAFIEIHNGRGRLFSGNRRRFKNLVIEGYRQFLLVQVRAQKDMETFASNHSQGRGHVFDWIEKWLGGESGFDQSKPAAQSQVLKWSKVQHGVDCVGDGRRFKQF